VLSDSLVFVIYDSSHVPAAVVKSRFANRSFACRIITSWDWRSAVRMRIDQLYAPLMFTITRRIVAKLSTPEATHGDNAQQKL